MGKLSSLVPKRLLLRLHLRPLRMRVEVPLSQELREPTYTLRAKKLGRLFEPKFKWLSIVGSKKNLKASSKTS